MAIETGVVSIRPLPEYDGRLTPGRTGEARSGMDDAQFEALVREGEAAAIRLASAYLKDAEEARDAVQEAFIKAYRKRGTFRGDASAKTWFFRLLVNHLKDKLRRRKVRDFLLGPPPAGKNGDGAENDLPEVEDPAADPERRHEDAAFRHAFNEAVAHLPARQREVCSYHLTAELTLGETARAMNITEGAVKAHFFRAVRTLREALREWKEATP